MLISDCFVAAHKLSLLHKKGGGGQQSTTNENFKAGFLKIYFGALRIGWSHPANSTTLFLLDKQNMKFLFL